MKQILNNRIIERLGIHINVYGIDNYVMWIDIDRSKLPECLVNRFTIQYSALKAASEVEEYLSGKRKVFSIIPKYITGTDFEQKIWSAICKVPYGMQETYLNIAKKIGHPKASRAVGNALGKNPIPVVVPCHRIIRLDGKIGGFTAGVKVKKMFLSLESKHNC